MRRLLLFALLMLLLAACGGNTTPAPPLPATTTTAPTSTPTPTATATTPPTLTPSPTPLPPAIAAAEKLIAPYARDGKVETSQAKDGSWLIRFTTPEGRKVELKDVSAENRTQEAQNWVENYNGAKILAEGKDENGTTWRMVEKNGERILMYDHQISYLSDIFPYILYSYDKDTGKFQAYVEPPGNGHAEDVHLHLDNGQWVDENGQPVQLTDFAQKFAKHYHWQEMDLQRVTIDNWEVMSVVDKEGNQWEVKEGKFYENGQEVAMPEVTGEATPSSLAKRAEDGKWYVMDERGLARWVIENGEVKAYKRPVGVENLSEDYKKKWPTTWEEVIKAQNKDFNYSCLDNKMTIDGQDVSGIFVLGKVNPNGALSGKKDNPILFPRGVVVGEYDEIVATYRLSGFVMRLVLPFNDGIVSFKVNNDSRVTDQIYAMRLPGDEWGEYQFNSLSPKELQELVQKAPGGKLPIWYGSVKLDGIDWSKWDEGEGSWELKRLVLVVPHAWGK